MEDIIIDETSSVLVLSEENQKYKIQLLLSEGKNGEVDKSSLILSAVATRLIKDKKFSDKLLDWFNNYMEDEKTLMVVH